MKHFKLCTSLVLSTAFLSSTVFAVSFNEWKQEVMMPPASPYVWTGYYAGLNLGLVQHTMDITDVNASTFYATIQQNMNPKWIGGLQAGYRRQTDCLRVSTVYGIEFSADFANAKYSKEYGAPFALYQFDARNTLKDVLLLQLTGGIAVDRALFFLAAGLSWINISGSANNLDGAPFFNSYNLDKKQFGTALGAGIEYAVTQKISARFKVDVISANNYTTHDETGNAFEVSNRIVQAVLGVNYNFA
jgi:opacity protein-like surface antigen